MSNYSEGQQTAPIPKSSRVIGLLELALVKADSAAHVAMGVFGNARSPESKATFDAALRDARIARLALNFFRTATEFDDAKEKLTVAEQTLAGLKAEQQAGAASKALSAALEKATRLEAQERTLVTNASDAANEAARAAAGSDVATEVTSCIAAVEAKVEAATGAVDTAGESNGAPDAVPADDPSVVIADTMPAAVSELLSAHKRVRSLFAGEGKPEFGAGGKRLSKSPLGYDQSFVRVLVGKGVTDPGTLASAVDQRPDGHARGQGRPYIIALVKSVLASNGVSRSPQPAAGTGGYVGTGKPLPATDVVIDAVRYYDSRPARWELDTEGHTLVLVTAQLLAMGKFKLEFVDRICRVPEMPKGSVKGKQWEFNAQLLMNSARCTRLPADAKDDAVLRLEVKRAIDDIPVGESIEDLRDGKALVVGDKKIFQTHAIERLLRVRFPKATVADFGRHLSDMKVRNGTQRVNPTQTTTAWAFKLKAAGASAPGGAAIVMPPLSPPATPDTTAAPDSDTSITPFVPAADNDNVDFGFNDFQSAGVTK